MFRFHFSSTIFIALGAAFLFGASTPLAKQFVGNLSPVLLAGLLYLGSGIGLILVRFIRDRGWANPGLLRQEWPWLLASIGFGGVLAPVLFMFGLMQATAASASLLLNLEAVFTAVLAWVVFKENTDRRIVFGMLLIVIGGIVLSWPERGAVQQSGLSVLAIVGACLCWAIDNNVTRKVSASDSLFIAGSKGLVAGVINTSLALIVGASMPMVSQTSMILLIGFLGYAISLVLFVLALRGLGTARTGAYFSTAPFIGALIAIVFFHETTSMLFWMAAVLMGGGVYLHLTECHDHEHTHEALFHGHSHVHDEHHQHKHDFSWDGQEPHDHPHRHQPLTHKHRHYPDVHHLHRH